MTSNDTTIYFWGPSTPHDYLSQHHESPFEHEGVVYHTAEMWMMVHKAKLFGDEQIVKEMLQTTNARKHKALGRKVKGFDGRKWDENKDRIVEEGGYWKFKYNQGLRYKLLATGERKLVEASPQDRIWGIGYSADQAKANMADWGENRLGLALMRVRERLRKEEAAS